MRAAIALSLIGMAGCAYITGKELEERLDFDDDGHVDERFGGDDCNDEDPTVHPGVAFDDPDDGIDSDCDGANECDQDGDGFDTIFIDRCNGNDCDDTDLAIHPGAEEIWYDGVDSDCDGASDYDADRDGALSAEHGGIDCDDADPAIYPGALDAWYDGVDADCDGADDCDQDGDGFEAEGCGVCAGDDCDDSDARIHPGAEEDLATSTDDNCNGNPVL